MDLALDVRQQRACHSGKRCQDFSHVLPLAGWRPNSTRESLGGFRMRRILTAVVAALALGPGAASAQDYPSRTITIIVPFSAGGPTDTVTRLVAESMSAHARPADPRRERRRGGRHARRRRLAQAEPDGYTLLVHHIGMATSATLYRNLPYDPRTEFAPIGLVTEVPMTIVARPDFPPDDLAGADQLREGERRSGHSTPMPASAPPRSFAACCSCRRSTPSSRPCRTRARARR